MITGQIYANENVNWATRLDSHMTKAAVAAVCEASDDKMSGGGPDAPITIDSESEDTSTGTPDVDTTERSSTLAKPSKLINLLETSKKLLQKYLPSVSSKRT